MWSISAATLAVWGIAVLAGYLGARHEANEFLDGQLAQSARLLLSQARHEWDESHGAPGAGTATHDPLVALDTSPRHGYEQPVEFQVWVLGGNGTGQLALNSPHAPAMGFHGRTGYGEITHDGREWRTLTQRDANGRFQVQVAQPTGKRTRAALEVAVRVLVPFAIALPLLVTLLLLAVGRGLHPLDVLARDVESRAPDALTPLTPRDMPREVQPLVVSLNDLLARLARVLENERRFTADAAHELRTPLAALQVQAQVARMARDEATRDHAVEKLLEGVARATHLVEQLLRLARLDPIGKLIDAPAVSVPRLAGEVAAPFKSNGHAKGTAVDVQVPDGLTLHGDPDLLGLALRNLLENALRYVPPGGRVILGADEAHGTLSLWVRDNGPGVAPDELSRLTERFYRGRDVTTEGSGLGLAIVHKVAALHGAELALENLPGGGFQATLKFLQP